MTHPHNVLVIAELDSLQARVDAGLRAFGGVPAAADGDVHGEVDAGPFRHLALDHRVAYPLGGLHTTPQQATMPIS
eukprot:scaffold647836_cov38-Prasinocladus_malaysianus.AAC.1